MNKKTESILCGLRENSHERRVLTALYVAQIIFALATIAVVIYNIYLARELHQLDEERARFHSAHAHLLGGVE